MSLLKRSVKADVILKSHDESSDYELYDQKVRNHCIVRVRDDPADNLGYPCMGEIEWIGIYGTCNDCGASYQITSSMKGNLYGRTAN